MNTGYTYYAYANILFMHAGDAAKYGDETKQTPRVMKVGETRLRITREIKAELAEATEILEQVKDCPAFSEEFIKMLELDPPKEPA